MQAAVTRLGSDCITRPVWGGMMLASWSWALFTHQSWPSHPNNTPSTWADTAPPRVPKLCVYKNVLAIFISEMLCELLPGSFGLKSTKMLSLNIFVFSYLGFLGFAFGRDLYICIPAAHPPGRPWGEDGVGEGRQRAWGGAGGPALQYALPGKQEEVAVYACVLALGRKTKWLHVKLSYVLLAKTETCSVISIVLLRFALNNVLNSQLQYLQISILKSD